MICFLDRDGIINVDYGYVGTIERFKWCEGVFELLLKLKNKGYKLVLITTTFSVAGGIVTYVLGNFFYQEVSSFLFAKSPKIFSSIDSFSEKFEEIGYIIILIGGFSPFPFKITCLASGILGINFFSFIILSFISRFSRFFIVGYFISKYGDKAMNLIKNNTKKITWILLMLLIILILLNFSKF